jgi:hypothetical protein
MDQRTAGIIGVIAAVLLCGLPGLLALCMGALFAAISFIPGAEIDMMGSTDPQSALQFGLGGICLGIILVLIPLLVWNFTLRRRPPSI